MTILGRILFWKVTKNRRMVGCTHVILLIYNITIIIFCGGQHTCSFFWIISYYTKLAKLPTEIIFRRDVQQLGQIYQPVWGEE